MEIASFGNMNYLIRYPRGYIRGEKYPILIFLHGAGTRGNNIELLKGNPFFKAIDGQENFPFITVAPQCCKNTWFDLFEVLREFTLEITRSAYADRDRIYLMGASMGGYATWQLAMSLPELFAAIVPICGGGMYWNAARLVHIPVWAFHGEKDTTVFAEESRKMVDAVNRRGGNAKLTLYPENGHDAWSDTYRNPEVFSWLLAQKKGSRHAGEDLYKGSKAYG